MKNMFKQSIEGNQLFKNFNGESLNELLENIYAEIAPLEVIISRVSMALNDVVNILEIDKVNAQYAIEKFIKMTFNTESLEEKLVASMLLNDLSYDIDFLYMNNGVTTDNQLLTEIKELVKNSLIERDEKSIEKLLSIYLYNKLTYVKFQDYIIDILMKGISKTAEHIEDIKDNAKFLPYMEKTVRNLLAIFIDTYVYAYESEMTES